MVLCVLALWLLVPLGSKRPNFIFLMIDTLRADAPGWARDDPRRSPFLTQLAARATRFTRAYSPSSWTAPAVASLLTSRYQSQHAIRRFDSILAEAEVTLPEALRQAGYHTAGFTTNILTAPALGYGQGFEVYDYLAPATAADGGQSKGRAASLHARALSWFDAAPATTEPFFLYLHYLDVHVPLHPSPAALDAARQLARPRDIAGIDASRLAQIDPVTQAACDVRDLYAGELIDLDREIEAFLRTLEQRGLLRNTVIVLVSDHGEEFLEHGELGHGLTLFDEVLRVPLVISIPGDTSGAVVNRITSTIDLAPTILDLSGVEPTVSFEGSSLRRILGGGLRASIWRVLDGTWGDSKAYAELLEICWTNQPAHQHAALITDAVKVLDVGDHESLAYDLTVDPREQRPLAAADSRAVAARADLDARRGKLTNLAASPTRQIDPETRERMRAIGYGL